MQILTIDIFCPLYTPSPNSYYTLIVNQQQHSICTAENNNYNRPRRSNGDILKTVHVEVRE